MSKFDDVDRLRRMGDWAKEIERLTKVVEKFRVRLRAQTHQTSITAQSISGKVNETLMRLDVVPEGVSLAHPCEQNVGTCIHGLLDKIEGLQEQVVDLRAENERLKRNAKTSADLLNASAARVTEATAMVRVLLDNQQPLTESLERLQKALSRIREAHRDDCAIYVAAVLGIIDAAIGPKQTENAE